MKLTYEEILIEILKQQDRPLKAKELIAHFQQVKPLVKNGTLRQIIYIACLKGIICQVKMKGFKGFYSLPSWFHGAFLKEKYKDKIYESKQIQIQEPTRSLGRTA